MAQSPFFRILLVPVLLLNASCAGVGWGQILDETLGGLHGDEISGEIRHVDVRRQEIQLTSGWGRTDWIRYDRRTEVVYGNRRYRVRDLERGDRVRIALHQDRHRQPYARYIRVQQSRRHDRYDRVQRIDGRVRDIDPRRGYLRLTIERRRTVRLYLPYDPDRPLRDRFRRLREGDFVAADVVWRSESEAELVRLR